jgi:hypothetical protein
VSSSIITIAAPIKFPCCNIWRLLSFFFIFALRCLCKPADFSVFVLVTKLLAGLSRFSYLTTALDTAVNHVRTHQYNTVVDSPPRTQSSPFYQIRLSSVRTYPT